MPQKDHPAGYTTLTLAIDDLTRRGFTVPLRVVEGGLSAIGTGQTLATDQVVIREFHRFEGTSDPDEMAIVYAIESQDGVRGTLVDAFGVYSDPAVSAALRHVPIRWRT